MHSAMLIDDIFINHLDCNDHLNGIIVNDISDHLPVFFYTSLDSFSVSNNRTSAISMRDFSEKNVSNFLTHLLGVNWAAFLNNGVLAISTLYFSKIQNRQ